MKQKYQLTISRNCPFGGLFLYTIFFTITTLSSGGSYIFAMKLSDYQHLSDTLL